MHIINKKSHDFFFCVQFEINKHLYIFQRPQIALALRARAILLVFEKFTRAYLFQIALEVIFQIFSSQFRIDAGS